jgi:hypothetical protein
MQSIGSRHEEYNKKDEEGDVQVGVLATQQQTPCVCCVGWQQHRQDAVELSWAGDLAGGGWCKSEEKGRGWEEGEGVGEVSCPAQTKYYCQTFHLIDKGNGAERPYDMGGKSRTHNWSPKIVFRLINMTMANAYRIYRALVTTRTPDRQCLKMKDALEELTFALMQWGDPMRTREASHPKPGIDLSRVLGWTCGEKVGRIRKGKWWGRSHHARRRGQIMRYWKECRRRVPGGVIKVWGRRRMQGEVLLGKMPRIKIEQREED